jgi:peptide/nickel transport system substrate-binding protein
VLRQGIANAIDRKRFTDSIMAGFAGDPQDLPWPNQSAAWEASKNANYSFDLDKARSLIAQSGVANPEFDLTYALAGFAGEYGSLAQIIQADLAQIGVKTTLKPLEIAAFTAAGLGKNPPYSGVRLNAAAFTNVSEPTSHMVLSSTFGTAINASGFYDDQYNALVKSAASEPDATKRIQVYSKINDYILDAAYCLPVSQYPNILIETASVHGLAYYPVLQWTIRSTWLS